MKERANDSTYFLTSSIIISINHKPNNVFNLLTVLTVWSSCKEKITKDLLKKLKQASKPYDVKDSSRFIVRVTLFASIRETLQYNKLKRCDMEIKKVLSRYKIWQNLFTWGLGWHKTKAAHRFFENTTVTSVKNIKVPYRINNKTHETA